MVWLRAALGLVILLFAGDALVKGAVNLALRIGIPALIVSLTIARTSGTDTSIKTAYCQAAHRRCLPPPPGPHRPSEAAPQPDPRPRVCARWDGGPKERWLGPSAQPSAWTPVIIDAAASMKPICTSSWSPRQIMAVNPPVPMGVMMREGGCHRSCSQIS